MIAALVVIRILYNFWCRLVGSIVLRIRRPDLPRPFRMWLYPLPALLASAGFVFILVSRTEFSAGDSLCAGDFRPGFAIYLVRAGRNREWPFAEQRNLLPEKFRATEYDGVDQSVVVGKPTSPAGELAMGSTQRAAVPLAVAAIGNFLRRHLDAKRRRGLDDDPAHACRP